MRRVVAMRIRRAPLFWGLFLIPLGALPLLVRADVISGDIFSDLWRWWPLILIGFGVAILLGRSRAGVIGTALVALVLGTLAGGALASGSFWVPSVTGCADIGGDVTVLDRDGSFSGDARATFDHNCGSLDVSVAPGNGWRLHAEHRGPAPRIDATQTVLTVQSPEGANLDRQDWSIVLGADAVRDTALQINAGEATMNLAGARLSSLQADVNAGDLLIDGGGGAIEEIDASVNAGRLRLTLGGATRGNLSVNAGGIDLCVPADATLRLDVQDRFTFISNLEARGLSQDDEVWTRSGSGAVIDLVVDGNVGALTLDPEGGCT
jgi:hypothetical protein